MIASKIDVVCLEDVECESSIARGKASSPKISSTGMRECAFIAPENVKTIYIRNVEVQKNEIRLAGLEVIEVECEGSVDLSVAARFHRNTWSCHNLETTDLQGIFSVT